MIEVENTDVNIVRNFIPMRNHMPASAYGLKAISDWFFWKIHLMEILKMFLSKSVSRLESKCHYLNLTREKQNDKICWH